MHKLASFTILGLTVAAASFGAAVAAGKGSTSEDISENYRPVCTSTAGATAMSRDLDWDGSDHFGLSVGGGQATYAPGGGDKVHASGNPELLAHLRVYHGNIELDCKRGHFDTSDLAITLPGREFKTFAIAGSGKLSLRKLDQVKLNVAIAGSGSINADGRVDRVAIKLAGSGNADLGQVAAQVVTVNTAGSGNADIAPSEQADIHIVGSGDVNLHTSPKRIETHILGSGTVHKLETRG